jgi:purine-nucleoside phosphorylase
MIGGGAEPSAGLIQEAIAVIASKNRPGAPPPQVGVVLGSGLAAFSGAVQNPTRIPYASIPHFPRPTAEGHKGDLVLGQIGDVEVAVASGRVHFYEGYAEQQVVYPVRVLARLGAETIILTNAAGGVNRDYRPGHFMVFTDHLNLTGRNPLTGPNDSTLGPRFPDMTAAYDADLRARAVGCFRAAGAEVHEGVYVGVLGPSYETPAEIRMFRSMGADAVGMSTVLETIAARHMGRRVVGISCVTNAASDFAGEALSHEAVLEESRKAEATFVSGLSAFIATFATAVPL